MAKQDYYDLLGLGREAGPEDIKKAYRKLAMRYHPDRNPGDREAEAKFKELSEAYDVLKDDEKRRAYDRFGHAAFEGNGAGGAGGFDAQNFGRSFADVFDDLFGEFMGGRRRGAGQGRGADLRYNLEITLEEAFRGKRAELRLPTSQTCEACHGTGAEGGAKPAVCVTCRGQGRVRAQQGFFTIERTCPTCHGAGQTNQNPCRACGGAGRVQRERTLAVNIPQGVDDGTRIRLSGEGEAGLHGGPPGDLYLFLSVKPHRLFRRDGSALHCRVPIAMTTAALGSRIEIPTLAGETAEVSIPAGTQSGREFRIPGHGMPHLRSERKGDLVVETVVETPVNLSRRQKELLREFDKAGGGETSPESAGFFAKVKEFFAGESKE